MSSWRRAPLAAIALAVFWLAAGSASHARQAGEVEIGSYKFVGRDEPLIATDRKVDLWAEVYRPKALSGGPRPLLVFLHGNHGTCGRFSQSLGVRVDDRTDYTETGACPDGYEVTPNHLGYAYLATELASQGYIVVSINANRGITAGFGVDGDGGLNLMRGRLILRHLALLSDWNRGEGDIAPPASLGFDPKGTMEFDQVGLMGHSRGGEGARGALQQFRDAGSPFPALIGPMTIRSVFEIGPVDGQTDRILDANGVNSIILLPSCDGDVSDLQGVHVFDRVFSRNGAADEVKAFHGTIAVWGANHNAYNSEWLTSDSPGCKGAKKLFPRTGRSEGQQATALKTLVPFFQATVGGDADIRLADRFDPVTKLPKGLTQITRYDRGYLRGPINERTENLERFTNRTGLSDDGVATKTSGVRVVHRDASFEHFATVRVAEVSWGETSPAKRFFQVNFAKKGRDLSDFRTFAFRVALKCFAQICKQPASDKGEMDFTVQLRDADGTSSEALRMVGRTRLGRPVGPNAGLLHSVLYTVSIPLKDFGAVDLSRITAVRFDFDRRPEGLLDISNLTVSTYKAAPHDPAALVASDEAAQDVASDMDPVATPSAGADGNRLTIRRSAGVASSATPTIEIVLSSKRSFPVTGAFPKLKVGDAVLQGGVISADGKTLTIAVPSSKFEALSAGADVSLSIDASSPVWKFGRLSK